MLHQLVTSRWLASHCHSHSAAAGVWRSLEGTPERPLGGASSDELQAIDRLRWIRMPNIFFFSYVCLCFCLLGTWNLCDDQEFTIASFWLLGAGIWHSLIASCATFLAKIGDKTHAEYCWIIWVASWRGSIFLSMSWLYLSSSTASSFVMSHCWPSTEMVSLDYFSC